MTKQRGEIIGDMACPGCRAKGKDKTGNHLILYADGGNWCKRCERSFDIEGMEPRPVTEKKQIKYSFPTLEQILKLKCEAIPDRNISKETAEYFEVRTEFNGVREPIKHYYPYYEDSMLYAHKVRKLPKTFATTKPFKDRKVNFFGQQKARGSKRLLIVSGEIDTLSAHEMFKKSGVRYTPDVVGFPQGENSKPFKDNKDFIDRYEEIIVCTDMDKAGDDAAKAINQLMGKRVKFMKMSEKDADLMYRNGKQDEFIKAFYNAKYWKPQGVVSISDLDRNEICKRIEYGLSYPWRGLTEITFGIYTKKVIAVGAGPGAGKTTFFEQIEKHLIFKHREKIGLYAMEGGMPMAVRKLVGSIMNQRIHLPSTDYDENKAWEIAMQIDPFVKLCKYGENNDIEDVFENMRWLRDEGVKFFFVDPTSALHAGMDASDANKFLEEVCYKWEQFTDEYDCTIFHSNHLTNPKTGKDHSSGGKVLPSHFAGSRAQWKFATDAWGLGRNLHAEEEDEKNIVTFGSLKSRMSGTTKEFQMRYNPDTGNLDEIFPEAEEFQGDF